ncbi:MAG: hypothetical protein BWY64_00464 [bacterium ADurb.Bin363]|nr:MAG: hypothetical protein BWY64_00464 [bacterium ADurb.Bin363]
MAFPVSMALPPPIEIINLHFSFRASLIPIITVSIEGSPDTLKINADIPFGFNSLIKAEALSKFFPVTINSLSPNSAASEGTSFIVPAPNIIRVAVANSNFIIIPGPSHEEIYFYI